jgi:hypothetical protein
MWLEMLIPLCPSVSIGSQKVSIHQIPSCKVFTVYFNSDTSSGSIEEVRNASKKKMTGNESDTVNKGRLLAYFCPKRNRLAHTM